MATICSAVAKSTGTACHKRALPGSRYCLFHIDRGPLLLGAVFGAVLSLAFAEGYRKLVPSTEFRQLVAARQETSDLKKTFTDRMDALMKANEALQKLLDPFKQVANRRFPQMDTEAALTKLADEVDSHEKELGAMRGYTEVSKLNLVGTTGTVALPLTEQTGISRTLEGAFTINHNHVQYSCDPAAITKFQEVIARFPDFPFSYYALAFCLGQQHDRSWKGYAMHAVEILTKTTTIDGHHPNHDQVLRELNQALHP